MNTQELLVVGPLMFVKCLAVSRSRREREGDAKERGDKKGVKQTSARMSETGRE